MLSIIFFLARNALCLSSEEMDRLVLKPAYLSDFINARQLRNLTVTGPKDLTPISGQYFRRPLFSLLQSLQPTVLQLRSLVFTNFDGTIINGEARGLAKFADVFVYDCEFKEGNSNALHIIGPSQETTN